MGISNPGQSGLEEVDATNEAFIAANVLQDVFNLKAPLASPTFTTSVTGSYLTASEILITDADKKMVSAAVATYPSLTELSRIKGLSSAVQTQLNTIVSNTSITAYGVGTAYVLTNTAAAVDFGTTDPVITLSVAGTYLIMAQIDLAYNGATVVAETATVKVRRTNNTAADLSAVVVIDLPVSTTLTNTYGTVFIPPFVYTTAATDDSVTIFANVSAALSAGSIDATAVGTSLVAIRLS